MKNKKSNNSKNKNKAQQKKTVKPVENLNKKETVEQIDSEVINEVADEKLQPEVNATPKAKKSKKESRKSGNVAFLLLKIVIALVVVVVIFYFGFTCTVREGSAAIITRFGEPRETITEAGLYLKLPWPFESVITYDSRENYYETHQIEVLTMDEKNIAFKSYVVWKIDDPLKYHIATSNSKETTDVNTAIQTSIDSAIASVMGGYNLSDLISSENENLKTNEIQQKIFERVKESCMNTYSIDILDVSILRLSYPDKILPSVLANIEQDRLNIMAALNKQADNKYSDIISSGDVQASQIISNGEIIKEEILSQAEKEVAEIYANAQKANIELFTFLKELDTIVNSVNANSVLVVDSNAYPFNILLEYSEKIDENTSVVTQLETVLESLPEKDRIALTNAICELIEAQITNPEENGDTSTESGEAATESGEAATESGEAATESGEAATESGEAATESGEAATESGSGSTESATDAA